MNGILLVLVTLGVSVQQVARKAYNIRVPGGVYSFSAASALAAVLVFIVTSGGKFSFSAETLGYAVAFAVSYSVSVVTSMLAIKTGPLSLSSLVTAYSLIIPTFYGLFALGEPLKVWLIIGIVLLLVSLFLINIENKNEEKKVNLKWGVYVLLSFVGNGACSTIQKVQQISSGGLYKNELMIIALLITVAVLFAFAGAAEKKNVLINLKKGFVWYTVCGLANGAVNYMVLILSNKMPASVMFPVISAGGVVLAAMVAVFIYKEKLSAHQWCGMVLGILAIVALNL